MTLEAAGEVVDGARVRQTEMPQVPTIEGEAEAPHTQTAEAVVEVPVVEGAQPGMQRTLEVQRETTRRG